MNEPTHIYEPGTIIQFTSGEYSDFGPCGLIVTTTRIDLKEQILKLAEEQAADLDSYSYDSSELVSFLIKHSLAVPVDFTEIHLGNYGEFSSNFGVNIPPFPERE